MTNMETDMKTTYEAALKDARRELAGLQDRRRALEATVAALTRLVDGGAQLSLGADLADDETPRGKLRVPPGFFEKKTPTEGYRELQKLWPGDYTGAEIRDAFWAGGMKAKSKGALLAQVHSVLRRERMKAEKEVEEGSGDTQGA